MCTGYQRGALDGCTLCNHVGVPQRPGVPAQVLHQRGINLHRRDPALGAHRLRGGVHEKALDSNDIGDGLSLRHAQL